MEFAVDTHPQPLNGGVEMLYKGKDVCFTVIEQPSFFSWYGYFGLISVSDFFIFYDDVQFERRSWQTRNRITKGESDWGYINVPVVKADRSTLIKDIRISYESKWRERLQEQLKNEYRRMPYFEPYFSEIRDILWMDYEYLADLDIALIKAFCKMLGIRTPVFLRSSEIGEVSGNKTDRLVSVMEKLGQKEYLSFTGARSYIIPEKFQKKEMRLYWYEFLPRPYEQGNKAFVSHMSIVDLLFRFGSECAAEYITSIAKDAIRMDNLWVQEQEAGDV